MTRADVSGTGLRYLSEFRDAPACLALTEDIRRQARGLRDLTFMEFCGGHTHAIGRLGIRQVLPGNIRLLSGPGCPVCVTAQADIDHAIGLARLEGVTIATFGDMMRVPGSEGSLLDARAAGADVRVVYSVLDALEAARRQPERTVAFVGVGFETTAPGVGVAVRRAAQEGLSNFRVLSLHKLTPPAMHAIVEAGEVRLQGVIGPGHVTTVIGADAWRFLPEGYGLGCAVAGFEPADILLAIRELVRMARTGRPDVANVYPRSVSWGGNAAARAVLAEVYEVADVAWRGLGTLPASGLRLRPEFAAYDADAQWPRPVAQVSEPAGCRCGEVLRGVVTPEQCPLFGAACTPEAPVGPCMVSSEGACAAAYEAGVVG